MKLKIFNSKKLDSLVESLKSETEKIFQREQYNLKKHYEKYEVHDIYFVPSRPNSDSALAIGLVGQRAKTTIYFKDKSYFQFKFDDRESHTPEIRFVEPSTERKETHSYEEASCDCRGEVNGIVVISAGRDNLDLDIISAEISVESDGHPSGEKYFKNDYAVLISDFHEKFRTLAQMYNTTAFYAGEYWRGDLPKTEKLPKYPLLDSRYGFEKCLMYYQCNQKVINEKLEFIVQERTSTKNTL